MCILWHVYGKLPIWSNFWQVTDFPACACTVWRRRNCCRTGTGLYRTVWWQCNTEKYERSSEKRPLQDSSRKNEYVRPAWTVAPENALFFLWKQLSGLSALSGQGHGQNHWIRCRLRFARHWRRRNQKPLFPPECLCSIRNGDLSAEPKASNAARIGTKIQNDGYHQRRWQHQMHFRLPDWADKECQAGGRRKKRAGNPTGNRRWRKCQRQRNPERGKRGSLRRRE